MEKLLCGALAQAIATFDACQVSVLSAGIDLTARHILFQVRWANNPDLTWVMLRQDSEWQYSAWERGDGGAAYEYNEGVYVPEVISHICRIWSTG